MSKRLKSFKFSGKFPVPKSRKGNPSVMQPHLSNSLYNRASITRDQPMRNSQTVGGGMRRDGSVAGLPYADCYFTLFLLQSFSSMNSANPRLFISYNQSQTTKPVEKCGTGCALDKVSQCTHIVVSGG